MSKFLAAIYLWATILLVVAGSNADQFWVQSAFFAGSFLTGMFFIAGVEYSTKSGKTCRPAPHAHEWGPWDRYHTVVRWWGVPHKSNLLGYRYYSVRKCSTCGKEQHDVTEVDG